MMDLFQTKIEFREENTVGVKSQCLSLTSALLTSTPKLRGGMNCLHGGRGVVQELREGVMLDYIERTGRHTVGVRDGADCFIHL